MIWRTPLVLLWLAASQPADAQQTLIPTPYPSAAPGAAPLNPEAAGTTRQQIMKDPYPQTTGPASQGNPPTLHDARRGQRLVLVPSIDQRKYRVDRPAR